VKIDHSFVKELGTADDTSQIIHTILQLARSLGMDVVAEGVETKDQLARLTEMGCSTVQGYFFSKPVDAEKAHWLIRDKDALQQGLLLKPAALKTIAPWEASPEPGSNPSSSVPLPRKTPEAA
jgi:predicted signal transduction protein with EAL and GGDEF domain